MPWCPICRNEYKEGYTHCNDCDADLVANFEDLPKAIMFGSEADMTTMQEVLKEKGLQGIFVIPSEKEQCHELFVAKEDAERAKDILTAFMQEQAEEELGVNFDEDDEEIVITEDMDEAEVLQEFAAKQVKHQLEQEVYVDKAYKSADYKSSGYTLIGVGVIGIALIVLHAFGVISLPINQSAAYMNYIVMGALFLIFVISGILALSSSKRLLKEDLDDKAFMEKANAYLETLTKEKIDTDVVFDDDTPEEMKYYKRIAYLNRLLSEQYPEAETALIDKLCEDYYDRLFGDE